MKKLYILLAVSIFGLTNCSSNSSEESGSVAITDAPSSNYSTSEQQTEASSSYSSSDAVHYSNPNTGTQSDYTLDVEYDGNGDVERINFSNGGWLDDSHITDQTHNGDGTITITTDKGYEYTVDESSDSSSASSDEADEADEADSPDESSSSEDGDEAE